MEENENKMKLAIFGSRTLGDERVDNLIQRKIDELIPNCIITSGETTGVNEIARNKAKENKITLILEFANVKKHGRGCYHHRSMAILKQCDCALFIHDGKSKGTKNEILIAKKMKVKYEYVKVDYYDDADINWKEIDFKWE
jgi:hypothetical protein